MITYPENQKEIADLLFTPFKLGNLTLRNRTIRAAAFEGMCPGNNPSDDLVDYHQSVAAGGIGMTTVAYAAVHRTGLSFTHQLWLRKEAVTGLRKLTDAVHREGAAASIQIGHCGLMAKYSIAGQRPFSPSGGVNLYGPTFPKSMKENDIAEMITAFGKAVMLARESGFDAVEVHAGHGYLISQFLSPAINKRKDHWGGSFDNRTRFMKAVMQEVKQNAGNDLAVLVKMNLRDGIPGGMELDESIEVARILEGCGADALITSGGLVNRSPLYIMRGSIPVKIMGHYMRNRFMGLGVSLFGNLLMKPEPYSEAYFLEDAIKMRESVKVPLVYVGGLTSREKIEEVLSCGFEFVSFARALIHDPSFVNKMKSDETVQSGCNHANYCIAVMYSGKMECYQNQHNLPEKWKKMLEKA
jgi:2,4-dienoyl-CoA reductase-like NADH-dependent reductase (Old Yellow Enzyme family)